MCIPYPTEIIDRQNVIHPLRAQDPRSWLAEGAEASLLVSGSDDGSIDLWQTNLQGKHLDHLEGKAGHDNIVSTPQYCAKLLECWLPWAARAKANSISIVRAARLWITLPDLQRCATGISISVSTIGPMRERWSSLNLQACSKVHWPILTERLCTGIMSQKGLPKILFDRLYLYYRKEKFNDLTVYVYSVFQVSSIATPFKGNTVATASWDLRQKSPASSSEIEGFVLLLMQACFACSQSIVLGGGGIDRQLHKHNHFKAEMLECFFAWSLRQIAG